jgi:hypothetical protein
MELSGRFHVLVALTLGKNRGNDETGDRAGPNTGLDIERREKSLVPSGIRTPRRSDRSAALTGNQEKQTYPLKHNNYKTQYMSAE